MDFTKLIPDFNAIAKTDWAKPQFETKDPIGLAGLIASGLMLVFVFCPWFGLKVEDESATRLGISLWYGIFAFLAAAAVIVGNLYNQKALSFCGAALGVVMGLIGVVSYASLTLDGDPVTAAEVEVFVGKLKKWDAEYTIVRWGAVLYLISSLVSGVCAFLQTMGIKVKF